MRALQSLLLLALDVQSSSAKTADCPTSGDAAWASYLSACGGNYPTKGSSLTQTLDAGNERITIAWAYVLPSGHILSSCVKGVCTQ